MTKSARFNRRKATALGIALASVSALAITTSTAQADIGPDIFPAGDARVLPAIVGPNNLSPVDGLNQPAPVVALGADGQPAASAQIRFHNQWRAGDRVLFQVRDSAGQNCANVPKSIGYDAVPTVVSSAVAYNFTGDSPMADNAVAVAPDAPVVAPSPRNIAPTFKVNLMSSTQCAANGIPDIVEILFTNEGYAKDANNNLIADADEPGGINFDGNAANDAYITDSWVLSLTDIGYDVGTAVTAGPLRNLPISQNATAAPGIFSNTTNFFGGNQAADGMLPLVQNMWTTTAFVLPVALSAVNPNSPVADFSTQNLGTITLAESALDGFATGVADNYQICYGPNVGDISPGVTATGATSVTVPVLAGDPDNCINFVVTGTPASDTVVLSNIFAPVTAPGPIVVFLDEVPAAFALKYLTPSDNSTTATGPLPRSNSLNSDVEPVVSPIVTTPVSEAAQLPERIGGLDRFETAGKIAANLGCSSIAVIANGKSYPDALSATYLAGGLEAVYGDDVPILLTNTDSIPQATIIALREVGVRSVYIVGGNNAVSQQVEDQLAGTRSYYCGGITPFTDVDIAVNRFDGSDRYSTNKAVIAGVQSIFAGNFNNRLRYQATSSQSSKRTAIVATGQNFADALVAGPLAYDRFPLILTNGSTLSPAAAQTMLAIDIEQVVIFGGVGAVSADVEAAIEARGITVIRLSGADRYETSVAVNNWALAPTFPGNPMFVPAGSDYELGLGQAPDFNVYMARGDVFADALASAPLVASDGTLLVLTQQNTLPTATSDFLAALEPRFAYVDQVTALGLGGAIATSVLAAANAAVN